MNKILTTLSTLALTTSLATADEAKASIPVETKIQEGLMVWTSVDDAYSLLIDGRLFLDYAYYHEDIPEKLDLASGSEVSRLRLSFKATHAKNWLSEMDLSFGENSLEIKDAWIAWRGIPGLQFKVGNFKEPFGLENMTSSRYENFIESSYLEAFPYGRAMGLETHYDIKGWQASLGIFQQAAGEIDAKVGVKGLRDNDEGYAVTGRTSVNALENFNVPAVLHLGASGSYRTTSAGTQSFLYEARTETRVSKIKFFTALIPEADHKVDVGFEAAAQYKRFTISGEYQRSVVSRIDTSHYEDVLMDGGYVSANVFLTNDQQQYSAGEGEFGKVIPRNKWGALQLLGRFSFLDLNEGGSGYNLTTGLTWHANTNHRIQIGYTRVNLDEHANAKGSVKLNENELDFDIYTIRFIALL